MIADGDNGQLGWIVVGIEFPLTALGIQDLPEIALLVEESYAPGLHPQIAGGLEIIAGQDAQAPGVNGKGLSQAELHAEITDRQRGLRMSLPEPGRLPAGPVDGRSGICSSTSETPDRL